MKLKKIKLENKGYNTSILDLLRLIDPSKTGKFMTLLLNELKFYNKSVPRGGRNMRILNHPIKTLNVVQEELLEILIECLGGSDVINDLEKFEVLCEENLIGVVDVQEYQSLGELSLAVIDAEEKRKNKDSSPHKEIVLDHPDYLILKPLNVFASKKYGASTKWCTSSRDPQTFYQYSEKGILIYILSKSDKSKWAVYYDMNLKELSWWDTKDILTDGYLVDLPEQLKKDILNYILNEPNYNSYYFDSKTKLNSKEVLDNINEVILDVDGDNIDVLCEPSTPSTLNVVWPPGINPNNMRYETTTTNSSEKIDSMVRKTLEYHYTISALNNGGEEMS
tara:strand:- start:4321 stop:5328 length:1008 start_codon:yes stop_codon:yes gene_type:complete